MTHPLRIAHRGMPRRARENTLASFALALDAGADGIELDVHASVDEVVVVNHDATVPGGDAIVNLTYREILGRCGADEHIPTLGDVCALVAGRAELFVEIKGAGIEALVVAAVAGYAGAMAIHSFDHEMIARIARVSEIRLGVLLEAPIADVRAMMRRTGALDIWPHYPIVDQALVRDVHATGGRVIAWTVNDKSESLRLAALRVDGLCSDDVTTLPVS